MRDCVFCDHDRIATPIEYDCAAVGSRLYDVVVFEPLNPVAPGHLLVVPVAHVTDVTEDPSVSAAAMEVAARVARRYQSSNIIVNSGRAATQSVFHLHLHVVPRHPRDGLKLPWSRRT